MNAVRKVANPTELQAWARVQELEDQVAYLRHELGLSLEATKLAALIETFGVTQSQARILLALYNVKGRVLSPFQLMEAVLPIDGQKERTKNNLSVHVTHTRAIIGHDAILNEKSLGYRMSPAFRERVADALYVLEQPRLL